MLRTVFWAICFVLSLVITGLLLPLWYVPGWLGMTGAQRRYGFCVSRNWARFLLFTAGVRFTVRGVDNIPANTNILYVSNHQGNFDIPVLFSAIPQQIGFLAKVELAKIPVINAWMPKLGCVFIDRGDLRQSIKALQKAGQVLAGGRSMVIFPEGTRSRGPRMGAFKKGSLRLAEKAGVPIIPVSVSGTYKAMEARGNRIGPARVAVTIGEPIYYDRLAKDEQAVISDIICQAIGRGLDEQGAGPASGRP